MDPGVDCSWPEAYLLNSGLWTGDPKENEHEQI